MKAIYIPYSFDPITDLEKLNHELKNTYSVEYQTEIRVDYLPGPVGILLIVGEYNRKDKLEKLNEISEQSSDFIKM